MTKGMRQVIDINTFLLLLIGILGSILLIILIVLSVKLFYTINRVNKVLDGIELKISKFDKAFNVVDILTDNIALISDKIVDSIGYLIRKLLNKKENRKEEKIDE